MINLCRDAGLPDPEFAEMSGAVVVIFRKTKPIKKSIEVLEVNARRRRAVEYVRQKGKITNLGYAKLVGVSRRTATRDLVELVEKGILRQIGKGRGSYFELPW
jgi:ATP-dependent DNA helicase RecG